MSKEKGKAKMKPMKMIGIKGIMAFYIRRQINTEI